MSEKPINFTEPSLLGVPLGEPILVALSGGADSSALLHLLVEYAKKHGGSILAAHVNHGIRGEEYNFEADRDELFCKELCDSLGVRLFVKRIDVPALAAASGRSLETEARDARYSFFESIMESEGVRFLATAHNSDDNIETQLFNLARGCGIDGMIGIPKSRELGHEKMQVIRPLIKAEKSEIIAYCEQNGVSFVTDSTNLESDYTRNAIRHKIVPILCEILPQAKKSAQRLSESCAEDSDFIFSEAKRFLGGDGALEVKNLTALHPALVKRVLLLAFAEISQASLEKIHIESLISLLKSERNGASVSLPDKKQASIVDGRLIFGEERRNSQATAQMYCKRLISGLNIIENTDFAVLVSFQDTDKPSIPGEYTEYATAYLSLDPQKELFAKNRSSGDCILDGGVNKKIKKLMCDKKVPLYDRDFLPLLACDQGIIYAPLCAVSDTVKPICAKAANCTLSIYKKPSEAKNVKRR